MYLSAATIPSHGQYRSTDPAMRYAILSDIHSNLPALQRVLAELVEADIGKYLCLGDIVGYGAQPNECCAIIQELDAICIRGNHDQGILQPDFEQWFNAAARACLVWTRAQLTAENRAFLQRLEETAQVDSITICHGSIPDPNFYITSPQGALPSFQVMAGTVGFFGHTHSAEYFVQRQVGRLPEHWPSPAGGTCSVEAGCRYLINPGAVGQPRDGNPQAAYAMYDEESGQIELRRVEYDIAAAQRKMIHAGLPPSMSLRLSHGL